MKPVFQSIAEIFGFPKLDDAAAARLAIIEADRQIKAAIDSDVLSQGDVERLTDFVHGRADSVEFFGKVITASPSTP